VDSLDFAALVDRAHATSLTDASARELMDAGGYQIAVALTSNDVTTRETLSLIAERFPAALAAAAGHPSASVELKDQLALGTLTGYSLEVYLEDRSAEPTQRAALFAAFKDVEPGSGPALGEVWAAIARE